MSDCTKATRFEAICPKRFKEDTYGDDILADAFVKAWTAVVAENAIADLTPEELAAGEYRAMGNCLSRIRDGYVSSLNYAPPGLHLVYGVRLMDGYKTVVLRVTAFVEEVA